MKPAHIFFPVIGVVVVVGLVIWLALDKKENFHCPSHRCYKTVEHTDSQDAAKRMDEINTWILKLIKHVREKYMFSTPANEPKIKIETMRRLLANYNPELLREHRPVSTENTSFVTNKTEDFAMCLRDPTKNYELHSLETLVFVAAHEISHMANLDYGHGPTFWRDFKFILEEAVEAGIYQPINYKYQPMQYCGIDVNYNPYFD